MNSLSLLKSINVQKGTFAELLNHKISYANLAKDINRLHHYFTSKSINPGDKVVVSCENDYHTSVLFLAILTYGTTSVFIDPKMPNQRANALIEKSQASHLFMDSGLFVSRNIDKSHFKVCLEIKEEEKKGALMNLLLKKKEDNSPYFPAMLKSYSSDIQIDYTVPKENPAYLIFTSGTTGSPKGVIINHGNLFSHLKTLSTVYGLQENSKILNILSLYHADGIIQRPILSAYRGITWNKPFSFNISQIGDLFNSLYKYEISHFITVPTVLSFLYTYSEHYEDSFNFEGFKFIVSVASNLEKDLWGKFENKFNVNIINVYGLTETVAGSLFSGYQPENKKIGTIGFPVDCEAKILNDDLEADSGILFLRGENVFPGYFGDEKATQAVFKDGWFNTGDRVFRDSEGYYTVIGREKNTINSGGFNIYPEQITEVINTHELIQESACLGVENTIFGETLECAVVLKEDGILTEMDLMAYLKPRLETYQIPKNVVFVKKLPKGISGKIQIQELRGLVESYIPQETTSENIQEPILEIAAKAFKISAESLSVYSNSKNTEGWDSMAHLVFIVELEKKYSLRFNTAEMMRMDNIQAAMEIVNRKIKE